MVLIWVASRMVERCWALSLVPPTPPQQPTTRPAAAAVYIEKPGLDPFGEPLAGGPPAQEVHRFLVHLPSELQRAGCLGGRGAPGL